MVGENVCGVVVPLTVTSIGLPLAIKNPQIQLKRLLHPQTRAVITVATIPMVRFCISLLLQF
jgi:hypothetical protein